MGTRRKRYGNRGLQVWDDDIRQIIDPKKQVYLKHLALNTTQTRCEYKRCCAIARREVRKIKRSSWDTYVSGIEHDVHGRQDKAYTIFHNFFMFAQLEKATENPEFVL